MKDRILEEFGKSGFIKDNDFKIIVLTEEECTLEYKVKDSGLNPIGIVHGGLLFGLADTTAGTLACMTGKFPLTINSTIDYLNPAKCDKLISKASILKQGNSIGYYRVDIYDEKDTLICTCNVTMYMKKEVI